MNQSAGLQYASKTQEFKQRKQQGRVQKNGYQLVEAVSSITSVKNQLLQEK
jgi:hypothetical protein